MVLPDSDRVSRVPSYSGYSTTLNIFRYEAFTLYGVPSQALLLIFSALFESYNPNVHAHWFGLVRVRSPLLAKSQLISTPEGT